MKNSKLFKIALILMISNFFVHPLIAQEKPPENSYYQEFPEHVTSRFYFSRKYTSLKIKDRISNQSYHYMPNSTLNLGLGATYRDLTLNLA